MKRKNRKLIPSALAVVLLGGNLGNCYAFAANPTVGTDVSTDQKSDERGIPENEISNEVHEFDYDDYSIAYNVTSHWTEKCNVSVTIKNKSDSKLHNWNLSFTSEDKIVSPYNAKIVQAGDENSDWVFKNLEYNQDINPGESVQFGFQVEYGSKLDIPEYYYVSCESSEVGSDKYSVDNVVTSEWNTGSCGELRITNLGNQPIEDWILTVRAENDFVTAWGADCSPVSEDVYEFECPAYKQNIAVGESAIIGYQINGKSDGITVIGLSQKNNVAGMSDASGNSVSPKQPGKTEASENNISNNDNKNYIVLDRTGWDSDPNGPVIKEKLDSIKGYVNRVDEVVSVSYEVFDLMEHQVDKGEVSLNGATWEISDIGFGLGSNELVFSIRLTDDSIVEERIPVTNYSIEYFFSADIDLEDSDDDKMPNYFEQYFHTDLLSSDTDKDGLDDVDEMYKTYSDPLEYDSIEKGISDGKADPDGDGLENTTELIKGTDPILADTDGDELDDKYEVEISGTDPTKYDTDDDGYSDKEEIDYKLNPLSSDSDGDGVSDSQELIKQEAHQAYDDSEITEVTVDITCSGNAAENVYISEGYDDDSIVSDTLGIVGNPVTIECFSDFDTAEIKFSYDESKLADTKEDNLCLVWYDEENKDFVLLEDSVVDTVNNTVTYSTTHFSTWFLIDKVKWNEKMPAPITYGTVTESVKYNYDIAIVLDYSTSEADLAKQKAIAKEIINQMKTGDKVSVSFTITKGTYVKRWEDTNTFVWAGTKQDAIEMLDYDWNGNPFNFFNTITSYKKAENTYNGKFSQLFSALNAIIGPSANKKVAYVFYPGNKYDDQIRKDMSIISTNINQMSGRDIKINTIAISYAGNNDVESMIQAGGGKAYHEIFGADSIVQDIQAKFDERVVKGSEVVSQIDSDDDGLLDVYETRGMIGFNGQIYYSDPTKKDSDGDGYFDVEEMGELYYKETDGSIAFRVQSDPQNPESHAKKLSSGFVIVNEDYVPYDANKMEEVDRKLLSDIKNDPFPWNIKELPKDRNGDYIYGLRNLHGCLDPAPANSEVTSKYFDVGYLTTKRDFYIVESFAYFWANGVITKETMDNKAAADFYLGDQLTFGLSANALPGILLLRYLMNLGEKEDYVNYDVTSIISRENNFQSHYQDAIKKLKIQCQNIVHEGETVYIATSPYSPMCGSHKMDLPNTAVELANLYLNRRTFLAFNATDSLIYAKCSCVDGRYVVSYDYYIWDYYDFAPSIAEDLYSLNVFGYSDSYMIIGDTHGFLGWDKD